MTTRSGVIVKGLLAAGFALFAFFMYDADAVEIAAALFALSALSARFAWREWRRPQPTPAELQALTDRWAVVGLLKSGLPYREIHKQTGVSLTTIGRVARCLQSGDGGYQIVSERLAQKPARHNGQHDHA